MAPGISPIKLGSLDRRKMISCAGRMKGRFSAPSRLQQLSLQKDLGRLDRHYRGLLEEQGEALSRLPAHDPRQAAILARIEAVQADAARIQAQTRERYDLQMKLKAVGALGVVYPRLVSKLTLSDKNGSSFRAEAVWDPVFERFEPLTCLSYRRPTYAFEYRRQMATCGCASFDKTGSLIVAESQWP